MPKGIRITRNCKHISFTMFKFIISLLFLIITSFLSAQSIKLKIVDASSISPLAFVNIKFGNAQKGVSTDIDGFFELSSVNCCESIAISYIGYKDTVITTSSLKNNDIIKIYKMSYNLKPVDILPSENPAFVIIRKFLKNRDKNNPDNLNNFSYKAYHKFIVTADELSIKKRLSDTNNLDSSLVKMDEFLNSQHLLIIESVSEKYHKFPDKNKEKVIATRVSGFSDPSFAFLSSELQSFSMYNNTINILDKHYINPLSKASLNRYFYLLEDSIFSDFDTTYIISFRPYKGTNFDGLEGQVHISSYNYAIKNIIVEPADNEVDIGIKIQQKYELLDGKYWFPTQLNSDLTFNILLNGTYLKGIGRTYLRGIKINKGLPKRIRFNNIVVEMNDDATEHKSKIFWDSKRVVPLDSLDEKTYRIVDSLGKSEHFDKKLWVYSSLFAGRIPWGPIDLELDKFLKYNQFEGLRMGLGLLTNKRFSKKIQLGAYGAWATKDYRWKYGANMRLKLWARQDFSFSVGYKNDVLESASQYNFEEKAMFNSDMLRDFVVKNMVYHKTISSEIKFRALPNSTWSFGANYSYIDSPNSYQFILINEKNNYLAKGDFFIAELHAGIRFAYKEKFTTNSSSTINLGTKFPIINICYTKALENIFDSELSYQKIDFQFDYSYYLRFLGTTSWRIVAAEEIGAAPWYKLYNGKGSYLPFYVDVPNSFGTMRINEFLSDRFVSVFFKHDFGNLIFGKKPFVPQPSFVSSFTIGDLSNPELHKNIEYKTLNKGYYESGILLNSILKSGFSNIGFGIFYRYGPYAFDKVSDNFSYKISLKYSL